MTINSFSDCTKRYDVTLDNCPCKGFQRWGHCQHNEVLKRAYQRARKATFEELRRKYDSRLNGQEQTRYLNYLLQIGA